MGTGTGRKFTAMLIFYYAMFAIGPAFYVVVLEQKGVAAQQIGIFTSMMALLAALAQPVYGYLCDKTNRPRTILVAAGALAVAAYAGLALARGTAALVLCSAAAALGMNATYGFAEGWLSKLGCEKLGVNFGAVRSFGSLSYALTAALYGFVYDALGPLSMPLCIGACFAGVAAVARRCPNPEPAATAQVSRGSFRAAVRTLAGEKGYVLVVVCYTLAAIPTGALLTYYPTRLAELGGTAASVGLAMFMLAGSEFFAMQLYHKLEARFGARALLCFSFLMFGVKNLCIGLAPTVSLAVLAGLTQALCFAIVVPATQSYVEKAVPQQFAATAQLVCNTGGQMLSQLPGALLGGALVNVMPAGKMLAWMSVFAFASCALFLAGRRWVLPPKSDARQ